MNLVSGDTKSCGCNSIAWAKKLSTLRKDNDSHKSKKTPKQFIEEAALLHHGRYDYSKSNYIGSWKKVIIICNTHGEFLQAPANHLFGRNNKGQGCPQCMAIEKFDTLRLTNKEI